MIRFLLISIFIHFLFVALISYQPHAVIENPIVAVEFIETSSAQKNTGVPTKVKKTITLPTEQSPVHKTEAISANENQKIDSASGENIFDTQQITKLPRVINQIKASYPEAAKKARIEGPVKLSVLIDPTGVVTEVLILEGPGHGLNETAQEALKGFKFSPAEKEGQKVSVKITYVYRFRLDSR